MTFGTRVVFDEVRELDAGSISGSFSNVGSPLIDHGRLISITNSTGAEVYISFDGINNHLRLASNSFKLLDLCTNKSKDTGLFLNVGTQIHVKFVSTTSATGAVWVEVMYGEGGK